MRILVTGATGFIGGRIVERLLLDRQEVCCSGRDDRKGEVLKKLGAVFYKGDLTDQNYVKKLIKNVDIVIHCAGLAGTWGTYQNYYRENVVATKILLDLCTDNKVSRFINISSPSIYFDYSDQFNLTEDYLSHRFSSHYAKTKFEAEKLVSSVHCQRLQTVSLRPRFVIGAGDKHILPRLIRLQSSGMLMQIGNGKNIVDITTVNNVVDAVFLCINAKNEAMGNVYNITNGKPVCFWKFIDMVMTKMGLATNRKKIPYKVAIVIATLNKFICLLLGKKKEPRLLPITVAALARSMTMNIEKAKNKLGYYPKQSTENGIDEFIKWWKKNHGQSCPFGK